MARFYARVIVHGVFDADDATAALGLLNDRVRAGIGADPADGHRRNEISIAAGAASLEGDNAAIAAVNEEYLRRIGSARLA